MGRLDYLREKMAEKGAGAMLVSSPVAEEYLAQFQYADGFLAILPETAYLVTDFRYIEAAEAALKGTDFEAVMAENGSLRHALGMISEATDKVLFEEDNVTVSLLERMNKLADGKLTFIPGASAIVDEMRKVKDEKELDAIAKAQSITDATFTHILNIMTPDMTEREVALEMEYFMRKQGASGLAFDIIAVSGSASSLPHGVPRDVKLEKGFLTLDFGAKWGGYCSDMTRTVVIGKADDEMKKLYNTVLAAQTEALERLREGFSCREADAVARAIIDGAGYKGCFGHSLGHGVGRYIHEEPRLSGVAKEGELLATGHVVTVEPGIYIAGKYGCRIEDMVAVTKDGIRNFTKSPKELIELF